MKLTKTEVAKINEVDQKLKQLRFTLEQFLQIYNQIDRKRQGLQLQIKILEEEREKLIQGQMFFDAEF